MDESDVEALAIETYERAALDPAEVFSAGKVIRASLGAGTIVRVPDLQGQPAALLWVNGEPRIAVNRRLPPAYQAFYALHELGHYALQRAGYAGDDEERLADLFAGCATATRPAMSRLYRHFGYDLPAIANHADSTESWAALRIAEVVGCPTALVSRQRVRVRGRDWVWGSETTIRKLAKSTPRGATKTRLRDDPRRVALVAEELAAA